jgi:drug/metabolite transporter (DMT)-like permease
MNIRYLGEWAALATSVCWTTGSVFFSLASRRVGALVLNRGRLVMALAFLTVAHWFLLGSFAPLHAEPQRWLWLGTSGIVGLALGDLFLFTGYATIGPRLTMLLMSLSPIITTLLAWIFLKQTITLWQALGIAVTLAGVTWVIAEKNGIEHLAGKAQYIKGLLAGLAAATCQSIGLVLARQGLGDNFSPISGNFIRMFTAVIVMWAVTFAQGQARSTIKTMQKDPKAVGFMLAGAFAAPFLGVSLSLLAIQHAAVGVASTLMALPPIFLLPISYIFFKERFGWQAIAGTLVAIAGTAILFLV